MSAKKNKITFSNAVTNSFKSPLFLAIAICFSVIFVAVIITTVTMGLFPATILALIFSGVSALCAWLLYATPVTKGKISNLRLYIAYRKVMNTFAIIFVSIFGAIIVGGCIALALMSDMIKNELVPVLEDDVKPMLEQIVSSTGELEEEIGDLRELYDEMPQEIKDMYGIDSPDEIVEVFDGMKEFAETALDAWDDIINFLNTGFMTIAIIVAVIYVLIMVALCFISSALKKTSKYLRAFAKNENTDRKMPYIVNFIGGGFAAVGAVLCIVIGLPMMGISALVTAGTVIVLAIFFKEMKDAREEEALAAVAADSVCDAPVAEEAVEEAPAVEEAVEEAPVAEEAVEEAPVAEEVAEEAPVVEEAATEE